MLCLSSENTTIEAVSLTQSMSWISFIHTFCNTRYCELPQNYLIEATPYLQVTGNSEFTIVISVMARLQKDLYQEGNFVLIPL